MSTPQPSVALINNSSQLPDTLFGLLNAAINEARTLDRELYSPYFDSWHHYANECICEFCLGGALIASRLPFSFTETVLPWMLPERTQKKLHALDLIRTGNFAHAYHSLYGSFPSGDARDLVRTLQKPPQHYFSGWEEFEEHLASLALILPSLKELDRLAAVAGSTEHSG